MCLMILALPFRTLRVRIGNFCGKVIGPVVSWLVGARITNPDSEKLNSSKVNQIINVGGGKGYTVYEIIKCVEKITNLDLKTEVIKRRRGDPDILVSNINKSKHFLSWEPKYSGVEQVISDSWEWYKYYNNLSQS